MLKIIGGKFKGKILHNIDHTDIRPTKSIARESLFNILENCVYFGKKEKILYQSNVLDLCCGTGALGLEAISRGASSATFIDISNKHINVTKKNISLLQAKDICSTNIQDINHLLIAQKTYNIVFFDPPYDYKNIETVIENLFNNKWCNQSSLIICETNKKYQFRESEIFTITDTRVYGKTKFTFLKKQSSYDQNISSY